MVVLHLCFDMFIQVPLFLAFCDQLNVKTIFIYINRY